MQKDKLVEFIQTILPMPKEKAVLITNYFEFKQYNKNDYVLRVGEVCNESHFLDNGFMRSYVVDIDGNDITTDFFSSPIFANDFLSFFKRIPATENIQAVSNCSTWAISYNDLQICFHTMPEFREFGRMMLINNYSRLKARMLSMIQLTAEQRYAKLIQSHPEVFQNTSLKTIATYIGVTDTSLSRIRKELVSK
jgi:CRP-like cAMP-binding protein